MVIDFKSKKNLIHNLIIITAGLHTSSGNFQMCMNICNTL